MGQMKTKTPKQRPSFEDTADAALVAASLAGDRLAFGEIVARYQSLLCSIAYSSLGNLSLSEDLAQEAFVEAWKQLPKLEDPAKVKAWLCGILRFKLSHHHRRESRQPLARAGDLAMKARKGEYASEGWRLALEQYKRLGDEGQTRRLTTLLAARNR